MRRLIVSVSAAALLLAFPAWSQDRGMLRVIEPGTGAEVAFYEESHALIIGNSAYTNGWSRLYGVRDDVPAVKEALERHGFQVQVAENLSTRAAMQQALDGFVRRFGQRPNNRLLIYYAGHGHTAKLAYGGEMGYLAPTGAPDPFKDPDGFHSEAISMEEIGSLSRRIQAKHALFVFDSCFSGTVFKAMRAPTPPSIQRKTGFPVRQFITSGDKDQPVPDSSVFRRQFVAALNGETDAGRDGYLTGTALGVYLETTVSDYTRNSQTPQYGKLLDPNLDKGDFVFVLKPRPRSPRAVDDRWKDVEAGKAYRLPVLDNDVAAAGGALRVASVGAVPRGRAEVEPDGKTITYTAAADGAAGEISFTYRVREEGAGEAEAKVTLTLNGAPKPPPSPRAVDDRWKDVEAGKAYRLPVLDNDVAAAGGALRVASVGAVPRGRAEVEPDGKTITYTAAADSAAGEISFTYRVREEGAGEAEAKVTLTLNGAPKPPPSPRAVDDRWKDVEAGKAYRLPVLDNDVAAAGGALRVASVGAVPRGRAEVEPDGKTITYTAAAGGAAGEISFTYRVREEGAGEAEAKVTLTLNGAPKPEAPRSNVIPVVGVFPQVRSVFKDCPDCPEMVVVPAGSFMMGSPDDEPERDNDEGPQHWVTIPRDFAAGRYEVTRGEFERFVSATGHRMDGGCYVWTGEEWRQAAEKSWRNPGFSQTDKDPAACVNWNDARAYAAWLSRQTKQNYRLLTEAEWEYAARAGTATPFSTGRTITTDQANFHGGYTYNGSAKGIYRQKTTAAGSFSANAFGLYDMHGNIWELVEDCYVDNYRNAPNNGSAVTGYDGCQRGLRGGSWSFNPDGLRSASRARSPIHIRGNLLGFRLARTFP